MAGIVFTSCNTTEMVESSLPGVCGQILSTRQPQLYENEATSVNYSHPLSHWLNLKIFRFGDMSLQQLSNIYLLELCR